MNRRTKEIKEACAEVMKTAEYCITCGVNHSLTPSHLFKRNAPYPGNDPRDKNLIVVQCFKCHYHYEFLPVEKKIQYWEGKGLKEIAQRMKDAISRTV